MKKETIIVLVVLSILLTQAYSKYLKNDEDNTKQFLSLRFWKRDLVGSKMEIQNKKLGYHVPNKTAVWRVETLLTKEPATIDWLNRLDSSSILLDVGANVGMYSIYASALRGSKVFAFEPESQNFSILVKNIFLNNFLFLV